MDFVEKAKEIFEKSAEASKKAVTKAGDAIQEFSDKSVLKLDIKKLQSEKKETCAELGNYVFKFFGDCDSLNKNDETVTNLLEKITTIEKEITRKEKILSELS